MEDFEPKKELVFEMTFKIFNKKILDLQREQAEYVRNYIEDNRIFEDGDKVLVTFDERYKQKPYVAFVNGCNVLDNGELFYYLYKMKKDGTMSDFRFRPHDYGDYKLEPYGN